MALKSIQLIREYAEPISFSESMEPEQNVFYATMFEIFSCIRWERMQAIPDTQPKSNDKIWIERNVKLFVKLDSGAWRRTKMKPVVPYAEECAWKVAELLKWSEVPKAVVIHESQVNDPEYDFYKPFMLCFMNNGVVRKCPVTFTFQTLVEGSILPWKSLEWLAWKNTNPKIAADSYQRAYLFSWLVGKGDACFCNTLLNPTTGTFNEIDNEVIGNPTYSSNGVLHRFASLKYKLIPKRILDSISGIDRGQLYYTLKSYNEKNASLNLLWQNEVYEPNCIYSKNFSTNRANIYQGTYRRLGVMQKVIKNSNSKGLSLRDIEKALEKTWQPDESAWATYNFEKRCQEAFDDPI